MGKNFHSFVPGYNPETKKISPPTPEGARAPVLDITNVLETLRDLFKEKPKAPIMAKMNIKEPFAGIANKLGVCGVELEHIMASLATTDDENTLNAFRQFLMMAKLTAVEPLQAAKAAIRSVEEANQNRKDYYDAQVEDARVRNIAIDLKIEAARKKMDKPWHSAMAQLDAALKVDRNLDSLSPTDQFVIKAMKSKMGGVVMIRQGKVYINFDKAKLFQSKVGMDVLNMALNSLDEYHNNQVSKWLNNKKNTKKIEVILNDTSDDMSLQDHNLLTHALLRHRNHVTIVTTNGLIRDGGPRRPGDPEVIHENSSHLRGYVDYNGKYSQWDSYSSNRDAIRVIEAYDRFKRY